MRRILLILSFLTLFSFNIHAGILTSEDGVQLTKEDASTLITTEAGADEIITPSSSNSGTSILIILGEIFYEKDLYFTYLSFNLF